MVFFKDFAISPRYYLHQRTINLHPNRELKRSPRGVLIHDRKSDQFWIDFGWILGRFWKDFGWLLASFLELYIRWVSKCDLKWILDDLGLQNERSKGVRRGSVGGPSGYFLALGAVFGPSWPQEASRIPPRGLLEPILTDSGPNLLDFGSQFGGFWMDFAAHFHWFLTLGQQINQINQPINQSTHHPRHGGG